MQIYVVPEFGQSIHFLREFGARTTGQLNKAVVVGAKLALVHGQILEVRVRHNLAKRI